MTGQLALVELRRLLLRNPYLWAVTAGTLALLTWGYRNQVPNLSEVTVTSALATVLVGVTLLLVANLATLRDRRSGMPETLAALPGRADVRTRAVLLAAPGVAGALAALVIGAHLLVQATRGPAAGRVDLGEVAAGVVAAALLAVVGVGLGRWAPSPVTGPAAVVMLGMGFAAGPLFLLVWYLPVTAPYEIQVYGRPAGPRVAYLLVALALLAGLTMLRYGRRRLRLGVAAVALAALVPAVTALAVSAPSTLGDPAGAEPDVACTGRATVTYCFFPGFEPWVPLWAEVAEPVAQALPPGARDRLPTVVQRTDPQADWLAGASPGQVFVGMTWQRGGAGSAAGVRLAGQLAAAVTGLAGPPEPVEFTDDTPLWCDGRGQARTVLALWLAGQAVPIPPATSHQTYGLGVIEQSLFGSVGYGDPELGHAEALLDRADARQRVWRHWDALTDPATTVDAALPLLGLPAGRPAEAPHGTPCD